MPAIRFMIQTLSGIRWTDVVDILIVAYLVYKVLRLVLRNSSVRRIAVVVGVFLLIALLTDALKLHTLNFLISRFLAVGVIAFVILFQPELRRLLDHLVTVRIRNLFTTDRHTRNLESVIGNVVAACEHMSQKRIGALIVFAQNDRLEEYFKTGTEIDGLVTEQLIRNIFFPKAALHDGAMIIRDGKIAAAGCVLPLSDSSDMDSDLGTRHRAGKGMSEATDAIVVIVSEETGVISVAYGGSLKRHLTGEMLEKVLTTRLIGDAVLEDKTFFERLVYRMTKEDSFSDEK